MGLDDLKITSVTGHSLSLNSPFKTLTQSNFRPSKYGKFIFIYISGDFEARNVGNIYDIVKGLPVAVYANCTNLVVSDPSAANHFPVNVNEYGILRTSSNNGINVGYYIGVILYVYKV